VKILDLKLIAFGPFTDQALSFGNGTPGLQIVYGPNEAGKSSSLRALKQWLYGIPERSEDNFLHSNSQLRIGGTLQRADGKEIKAIRRKGRSKTLRCERDAEVLEDSVLSDLLQGVNRDAFDRRFGLDHHELRKGGAAIVNGGGDLGEILFSAGAGLGNFSDVQKRLDEEAASLFKPLGRGGAQSINRMFTELKEAREQIKERQLPPARWQEVDSALTEAEGRQQELDRQLSEKRILLSRWERLAQALPVISRWKLLTGELHELADVPLLPPEFSHERISWTQARHSALETHASAQAAIQQIQAEIDQLDLSQELLEQRSAITTLYKELGSVQKAERDRPGLIASRDAAEKVALRLLQELGRPPQLENAEELRISRGQKQRIQHLASDCNAQIQKQRTAEESLRNHRKQLERIEQRLQDCPPARDISGLERAVRRAEKQEGLDQRLAESVSTFRIQEEQIQVELARLPGWSGSLEDLEPLAVPALETVERFEHLLTSANQLVAQSAKRDAELTQQLGDIERKLEQLRLEQDVPTEEELIQVRRDRDEGWRLIQQVWREGKAEVHPEVQAFVSRFAADRTLDQAFRELVAQADLLSDRLRREADRVATNARLQADRNQVEAELRHCREETDSAKRELNTVQQEWNSLWQALSIAPESPREMRAWLHRHSQLMTMAREFRQQRELVSSNTALQTLHVQELLRALESAGEPFPEQAWSLEEARHYGQRVADQLGEGNRSRDELLRQQELLQRDLETREQDAATASQSLESWRDDWEEAISLLNLKRESGPQEANAVLEAADELLDLVKEFQQVGQRIAGIDRDAAEFQRSVKELLQTLNPDLLPLPVERAVPALYDQLERASAAQATLDAQRSLLQQERERERSAASKLETCDKELAALCRQAGCERVEDLVDIENTARRKSERNAEVNSARDRLLELAAGTPLEVFLAEAEQQEPDRLHADLQKLETEIEFLQEEQKIVSERVGQFRAERQRMDGSSAAADAQERVEHLLASLRHDSEQFIQRHLASVILRRVVKRYRETGQGPVLARVSDLFRRLTLGAFEGVRADYNDSGSAILVGVRPNGSTLEVVRMSEGTGDQLYLALRIALLESSLNSHEPLPLIVDDLLVMFDDARSVAALQILAELSTRTQVIFFTHHGHLLDLARQHLTADQFATPRLLPA